MRRKELLNVLTFKTSENFKNAKFHWLPETKYELKKGKKMKDVYEVKG